MSWSISAIGYPTPVIQKLREQSAYSRCTEPEQTIRSQTIDTIALALDAYPSDQPVEVIANGSQSKPSADADNTVNQLFVSVKPVWGFLRSAPPEPAS